MRRIIICILIQFVMFGVRAQDTLRYHYQVGVELGKYTRPWQQFKAFQLEVAGLLLIPKVKHYFPKISVGYGDNINTGGNYTYEIKGLFFKPGCDYYFGKFKRPFRPLVSANLIYGRYNIKNDILIENPVWGNSYVHNRYNGGIFGLEFGGGASVLIERRVEIKIK